MKYLRGVPYVYNVPDLQVEVAKELGFMRNNWLLRLALALENFFLRESWKVSTVTHKFIEHFQLRGLPRKKITYLPNGADTEFSFTQTPKSKITEPVATEWSKGVCLRRDTCLLPWLGSLD